MKNLQGAVLFGQSGGPTSVINASASGVFLTALKEKKVTKVYGALHGIRGILNEELIDLSQEDENELELLKTTPSSALGSVRYKLKDAAVDETDYKRLLEVFKAYDVRFFFYNGGNDSMDTCNKISKYMAKSGWDMNVVGVPKTIDNDLFGTDHCPGYGSAAKFIATSLMEVNLDMHVYDTPMICIVEIMGRNAGWLTAAASLATCKGYGPDLLYLPEEDFDLEQFYQDVARVAKAKDGKVLIAVSEGIHDKNGKFIPELAGEVKHDSFGHAQLGGTASVLVNLLSDKIDIKMRAIELSLLQRCAAHCGSRTDIDEAFNAGKKAVEEAVSGVSDKMVIFKRLSDHPYVIDYELVDLALAANTEKKVPLSWIKSDHSGMTQEYYDYALPLIQGDARQAKEDSLPRFARLKKVLVEKR